MMLNYTTLWDKGLYGLQDRNRGQRNRLYVSRER